ncbi:hypothetical protein [Paragemmobacter ruber]|uniref:Uncharacterized protein n=1 Tax=Paragemmobacter ruber TaxID=1985673 RepID=A0ABW9Y857_9RHOB|nr:hypothetical protein [Rhodobacter ruber]NBE08766.1 hypothetical protein [Rhodobacter ruber]
MTKDRAAPTDMAALVGEAVEAMAAGQAMGLALLRAEMEALAHVLPPAARAPGAAADEARARDDEAAREAGFDNMPV